MIKYQFSLKSVSGIIYYVFGTVLLNGVFSCVVFAFVVFLLQWLSGYADNLGTLSVFEGKVPNHVLVNEYEPGQGIMVSSN